MDIFFLTNGISNTYQLYKDQNIENELNVNYLLGMFNNINNTLNLQEGGSDSGAGESGIGLVFLAKLFIKIFAWLLVLCFFGPMFPWIIFTYYTFKRLFIGYKIYFRQM